MIGAGRGAMSAHTLVVSSAAVPTRCSGHEDPNGLDLRRSAAGFSASHRPAKSCCTRSRLLKNKNAAAASTGHRRHHMLPLSRIFSTQPERHLPHCRIRRSTVCSSNICWQEECVSKEQRRELLQQKGCVVWLTGLSGSGKSTVAFTVDRLLTSMGKLCYVLDGDNLRHGLCKNLGFSSADRQENMRRVGEIARLFAEAGLITCVSLISPYKRDRDAARDLFRAGEFIEVFMNVPLDVCERRDCKGLYKLARAGLIKSFTGIDDPYEKPVNPEISLKDVNDQGANVSPDDMARTIIEYLSENGYLNK